MHEYGMCVNKLMKKMQNDRTMRLGCLVTTVQHPTHMDTNTTYAFVLQIIMSLYNIHHISFYLKNITITPNNAKEDTYTK